jgi:hypothetical protein
MKPPCHCPVWPFPHRETHRCAEYREEMADRERDEPDALSASLWIDRDNAIEANRRFT